MSAAGTELIEGVRPVLEAIRAGRRRVLQVSLPERDRSPGASELRALVEARGIRARIASEGVCARAEPYPESTLEDLLSAASPRFLVALDRVTDVGNLGAIARSAESAGATGLLLEHRHAPPIRAGALRASAGALEHLQVGRTPNLRKGLELARAEGLPILAAEAGGPALAALDPALLTGDLIWVFGSEDKGLRAGVRAAASAIVGISLHGRVESLGVAAAAAYLLHRTAEIRAARLE
jgi:23S rRNA (guanosine2251-2'-O)-methyltransferase